MATLAELRVSRAEIDEFVDSLSLDGFGYYMEVAADLVQFRVGKPTVEDAIEALLSKGDVRSPFGDADIKDVEIRYVRQLWQDCWTTSCLR
jgi:hypothetical protein